MFDDIGPIGTYGEVVEKRQLAHFFFGAMVLSVIGVFLLAGLVTLLAGITLGAGGLLVVIMSVSFLSVAITVLGIRRESSAVFVPYFRVSPTDGCEVYRSAELLDAEQFEYQVIVSKGSGNRVVRYRGQGETRKHVDINAVRQTTQEQIAYDTTDMVNVTEPVNIATFDFS